MPRTRPSLRRRADTKPAYRYSHVIGLFGYAGRGFYNPVDVALGQNGVLYVLNRAVEFMLALGSKRVTMCTVAGDFLGEFSGPGTGDGQLMWPVAVACDRDGNVYVSDEALHRVSVFDKDGQFLRKWGVKGQGEGEFDRPSGMAFDRDDNLLVVDSLNSRVQRYTKDGRYLGGWGRAGTGDGEFNLPWGIAVDTHGDVYVADWRNDRIQSFDAEGRHLATWGASGQGEGQFKRPSGVAVDEEGVIYVADWRNERVQVLGPDGGFVAEMRGDATLSRWAEEYFETNQDELELRQKSNLEPELVPLPEEYFRQEQAFIEKLFWGPTSVKVDAQGRVYVVDSGRHRIQIYQKEL